MVKITKKQRVALKEIDKLSQERKSQQIRGAVSIGIMALIIALYNLLVYQLGIVDEGNLVLRAMLYITAMVIAGYSGIMLMRASRNGRKIDGYRQSNNIARDTLDAWKRGEIE